MLPSPFAQVAGVMAFFGEAETGTRIDLVDFVKNLRDMLSADAVALRCEREVKHANTIVREGSRADRQLDHYSASSDGGSGCR